MPVTPWNGTVGPGVSQKAVAVQRSCPISTVLIVEDDGLLAFDLKELVRETTGSEVAVAHTLRDARAAVAQQPAMIFALLDVELADGDTFDLARELSARHVPFAFVSGDPRHIPQDLCAYPFFPKPYRRAVIVDLLQTACAGSQDVQDGKRHSGSK